MMQADGKKTGRGLWGHLSNIRLAQKLIQALHTEEDITDISACENLLESYFAQACPKCSLPLDTQTDRLTLTDR